MSDAKQQIVEVIDRLRENISRLEATMLMRCWQKGYVANCNATIARYKEQIIRWEMELAA